MRIQIVVGGRFHANFMARALLDAGHDVHVATTLPRRRILHVPRERVTSFISGEIAHRLLGRVRLGELGDRIKIQHFGREAGRHMRRIGEPDLLIGWSSFAKESFAACPNALRVVVRGSCHIDFQDQILAEEQRRHHVPVPNRRFVRDREVAEYAIADHIIVPSGFARSTFLERGFAPEKVACFWLGVDTGVFHPPEQFTVTRPLRVLNFGSLSLRKGIPYLLEAAQGFSPDALELRLVGGLEPVVGRLLANLPQHSGVHVQGAVDRATLNRIAQGSHVFVMPTLEEGFAQSLIQAMAAGLLPIATPNAGSSEIIKDGVNGFVIPARDATTLRERLRWVIAHPEEAAAMRRRASQDAAARSWQDYGKELSTWVAELGANRGAIIARRSPQQRSL